MSAGNVAERLQALLAQRALIPGERLPPERQLAAELGVSRSSLREGLRRLVDLGIVQARQGSGTYVAEVDLEDLLQVRMQLEPYAAGLAARRRSPHDLERLRQLLAELRATRADPRAFAAVDLRLHAAVVDAASSPALRILLVALGDLLRHSRATTAPVAAARAAALAQMERIVAAIDAGDARAAERAMRTHLRDVAAALGVADRRNVQGNESRADQPQPRQIGRQTSPGARIASASGGPCEPGS